MANNNILLYITRYIVRARFGHENMAKMRPVIIAGARTKQKEYLRTKDNQIRMRRLNIEVEAYIRVRAKYRVKATC